MVHEGQEGHVAQEGAFSAATSDLPVLQYFPARGRAEPIRLALAYAHQEWFEPPIAPILGLYRRELDGFAFRQLPRFIDERNGRVDIVQSMAILRHVGRKFGLYGQDEEEATLIDMAVDGAVDLRQKLRVFWTSRDDPEAAAQYSATVLATEEELTSEGFAMAGPGLACLERLAAAALDESPWLGGCSKLTIADIVVFDLVDVHLAAPSIAAMVKARFPALAAHHRRVASQPGIKEYLASANRHTYVVGDDWRRAQQQQQQQQQQEQGRKQEAE